MKVPDGLLIGSGVCAADASIKPQEVYDGQLGGKEIRLRIANGGAGQSGFIAAWANAFIQYCVKEGIAQPFRVRSHPLQLLDHSNKRAIRLLGILGIQPKAWDFSPLGKLILQ